MENLAQYLITFHKEWSIGSRYKTKQSQLLHLPWELLKYIELYKRHSWKQYNLCRLFSWVEEFTVSWFHPVWQITRVKSSHHMCSKFSILRFKPNQSSSSALFSKGRPEITHKGRDRPEFGLGCWGKGEDKREWWRRRCCWRRLF